MSFQFGFYDSMNGDRRYNAQDFCNLFNGIINDGVFSTIGECFAVKPAGGLMLSVGTGRAWFNNTWNYNSSDFPLTLPLADLILPRIDAVVIEVNKKASSRANSIKVVEGTPATSPQKPTLQNGGDNIWQYPLAYVAVPANAISITASMIETMVGRAPCPFVTGIIQTSDISILWAQWNDMFMTWFNNLGEIMDEQLATKVINRVDTLSKNTPYYEIIKATATGGLTGTWTAPMDIDPTSVRIIGVGGAGGGGSTGYKLGASSSAQVPAAGGGGGGYRGDLVYPQIKIVGGVSYSYSLGKGGKGGKGTINSDGVSLSQAEDGGNTYFNNILVANGGKKGENPINSRGGNGGDGGGGGAGGGGGSISGSNSFIGGDGGDGSRTKSVKNGLLNTSDSIDFSKAPTRGGDGDGIGGGGGRTAGGGNAYGSQSPALGGEGGIGCVLELPDFNKLFLSKGGKGADGKWLQLGGAYDSVYVGNGEDGEDGCIVIVYTKKLV